MPIPIPFLIAGVIALVTLVAGCDDSEPPAPKQTEEPPAPPPPDPFAKDETHPNVEPDSLAAYKYLWGKDPNKANLDKWHRDARIYFGAADRLYKIASDDEDVKKVSGAYTDAVKSFFEKHYEGAANQSEEGLLVLIAGLAPTSIEESVVFGAIQAMGAKVSEELAFVDLIKAFFYFNKAVEKADNRYAKPDGHTLKLEEKKEAMVQLEKLDKILKKFDEMDKADLNKALTDEQQVLLETLKQAAADYGKTLIARGGRGKPPPPPPPPPPPSGGWKVPNPGK
ncbi:MAG: hypothetical protein ABH871_01975 [Pseudomonadota bacterium]